MKSIWMSRLSIYTHDLTPHSWRWLKRRVVFAMVLTGVLGFATLANAYPTEVLINGGFDASSFDPWITYSDNGASVTREPSNVVSAPYAAKLELVNPSVSTDQLINLYQNVPTIPAGTPFAISFEYYMHGNIPADSGLRMYVTNGTTGYDYTGYALWAEWPLAQWKLVTDPTNLAWSAASTLTITAPFDVTMMGFRTYQMPGWSYPDYTGSLYILIDDVSLKLLGPPPPVTTVPEPATLLLLGSGLIGLAGYGRKKFFKK